MKQPTDPTIDAETEQRIETAIGAAVLVLRMRRMPADIRLSLAKKWIAKALREYRDRTATRILFDVSA